MDLLSFSASLTDPRSGHYKMYSSKSIFYIALCAIICGAESWYDVQEFGHYKEEFFRSSLPGFTGIPSHDTFNRFFSILDPVSFEQVFRD
ncbi:MAG: transposase family protein [Bacteroides sp.]|nr:transposase family protein [Bacteroides sp.]